MISLLGVLYPRGIGYSPYTGKKLRRRFRNVFINPEGTLWVLREIMLSLRDYVLRKVSWLYNSGNGRS